MLHSERTRFDVEQSLWPSTVDEDQMVEIEFLIYDSIFNGSNCLSAVNMNLKCHLAPIFMRILHMLSSKAGRVVFNFLSLLLIYYIKQSFSRPPPGKDKKCC